MNGPRILFYAQYLKGIGHVMRAKRIAEELARRAADVTVVVGGNPIPDFAVVGARVCQLPPLSASETSYSQLLQADGTPADEAYKASRCRQLLAVYRQLTPEIVITDTYPVGRWAMQFELEPLLAAAWQTRPRPLIIASLRDILQLPKTPDKIRLSVETFERYYDQILVHGDPNLVRIETSFPPLTPFLGRAHYTGIVAPPEGGAIEPADKFDVIVSGGGGAVGHQVLGAAIGAKGLGRLAPDRWLALAGPRMPQEAYDQLAAQARQANVTLVRHVDNLAARLRFARLSVQRAGYNTVAELMRSHCRAVLVPDAANRQMEQTLRAAKLEELGRAVVVREAELSAQSMALAIERAMENTVPALDLDLDGAAGATDAILRLLQAHNGTLVL